MKKSKLEQEKKLTKEVKTGSSSHVQHDINRITGSFSVVHVKNSQADTLHHARQSSVLFTNIKCAGEEVNLTLTSFKNSTAISFFPPKRGASSRRSDGTNELNQGCIIFPLKEGRRDKTPSKTPQTKHRGCGADESRCFGGPHGKSETAPFG